ncbi:MAG: AMP-binding protein [Streptosporangiaceae bacterium]
MTEHILALADRAGYGAALIDAAGAAGTAVTTWPQFADTVRAAARGLSRRGLLDTDTVGVLVADAASHAVAIHAIRAAGAIAAPIHPAAGLPAAGTDTADIATQLKQCRARLLITSAALAELAIEAAERSWVRQVYAFGDAEGTTPFSDLLETAKHGHHGGINGHVSPNGHDSFNGHGSHTDGRDLNGHGDEDPGAVTAQVPGPAEGGPALRLTSRDVVVAGPPCGRDGTYASLLDLALSAGATIVAAPLAQITAAVEAYKGTAAIVPCGTEVPVLPAGRILTVG